MAVNTGFEELRKHYLNFVQNYRVTPILLLPNKAIKSEKWRVQRANLMCESGGYPSKRQNHGNENVPWQVEHWREVLENKHTHGT